MNHITRIALLTIGAIAFAAALALSATFALATQSEALRPLANLGTIITVVPVQPR